VMTIRPSLYMTLFAFFAALAFAPEKTKPLGCIKIGLAYDHPSPYEFRAAMPLVAKRLGREVCDEWAYRFISTTSMNEPVEVPAKPIPTEMAQAIANSFGERQEHYFLWSKKDVVPGGVRSFPGTNVTVIDKDSTEPLDRVIARAVRNAMGYFQPVAPCPYKNAKQKRTITVNVGLDGVPQATAEALLEKMFPGYFRAFNIDYVPVGFYVQTPTSSWNACKEMARISQQVTTKSDIYVLFSNRSWKHDGDAVVGIANPYLGYALVEVDGDLKKAGRILAHELGHLLEADHVYGRDLIMHPSSGMTNFWSRASKCAIWANKDRTWALSGDGASREKLTCLENSLEEVR